MLDWNTTEMSDNNVTLRMLYFTIVIIAMFVTFGVISVLHEHGIKGMPYPFYPSAFYVSKLLMIIKKSTQSTILDTHDMYLSVPYTSVFRHNIIIKDPACDIL